VTTTRKNLKHLRKLDLEPSRTIPASSQNVIDCPEAETFEVIRESPDTQGGGAACQGQRSWMI
jgi:hypothetical protein